MAQSTVEPLLSSQTGENRTPNPVAGLLSSGRFFWAVIFITVLIAIGFGALSESRRVFDNDEIIYMRVIKLFNSELSVELLRTYNAEPASPAPGRRPPGQARSRALRPAPRGPSRGRRRSGSGCSRQTPPGGSTPPLEQPCPNRPSGAIRRSADFSLRELRSERRNPRALRAAGMLAGQEPPQPVDERESRRSRSAVVRVAEELPAAQTPQDSKISSW